MNKEKENMEMELVEPKEKKHRKKSKKTIIIIIVIVAILLLLIAIGKMISSVSKGMQEAMENMASQNEDIFQVVKQDVEQEITTSGTVVGVSKEAYTSPVTAKVEDIKVEIGQTVSKGDVLLTYDASELGDNLTKVKIQAQSERAAGNESYEAANKAADKVSEAKKRIKTLKKEINDIKKKIASLTKKVEEYEEKMEAARNTDAVKDNGDDSVDVTEEAGGQGLSDADSKAYKKAASDLQKQNEKLAAKQEELAQQESIVAANEDVTVSDSAKAQISASNQLSDMNVDDAQESLDAAEAGITAAADGIVESIDVVKGAYANETQTLMTIINADSIGVEFSISKDDLGSITTGQRARVVIAGNEYEGRIDYVSRVAVSDMTMTGNNTSGTIKGRILIDNPDDNIYIGVSAKAYIFVGKSEQALVIPYEALNTDIDGDFVYVVNKENLIERKDVTIGIYSDEYYEVIDGIDEGDKVIAKVTKDMKPGDVYVGAAGVTAE